MTSIRSVTNLFTGLKDWAFVYNWDHDSACQADGVAAGKSEKSNSDSQGRPCDWLMLGEAFGITSTNADYGQYYFDFGAYPDNWYSSGPNPTEAPCAMPVYHTNYQEYAFDTCMTDHGWKY